MKLSAEAVVLTSDGRKESDRIVTLLCRDGSLIRAYASGARNPKNRLCAATEQFVSGSYDLFESNGGYVIDDAEITRQFFKLRRNVAGYALAGYLAQLISAVFFDRPGPDIYGVFINMLFLLSEGRREPKLLKAATEFRVAADAGWCPDVKTCPDCPPDSDRPLRFFSIPDGRVFCEDCAKRHPQAFRIDPSVLKAVACCVSDDPKEMFRFNLTGESLNAFSLIAEAFVKYYIEAKLPALDYYHIITEPPEDSDGIQH